MGVFKEMKPTDYATASGDITYPLFAQPYIAGARLLVERVSATEVDIYAYSRDYNTMLAHLETSLVNIMQSMPANSIVDGYIYKKGWSFTRIMIALAAMSADTLELEVWLMDMPSHNDIFAQRVHRLDHYIGNTPEHTSGPIFRIPFEVFKQEDEIEKYYTIFTDRGYDGIILRNADGIYVEDMTSTDFQIYEK